MYDKYLGLVQKVRYTKEVQQILENRTKSKTTTSIVSKMYNLYFEVTFQISPPKRTPKSNP